MFKPSVELGFYAEELTGFRMSQKLMSTTGDTGSAVNRGSLVQACSLLGSPGSG